MLVLFPGLAAWAGVPISLPSSERSSDWEQVLELGDLEWATTDPMVVVSANGALWTVRVRDPAGGTREASIAPPSGADDREDLVWLVVSLLTPVRTAEPVPERDPEPVRSSAGTAPRPRPPVPTVAVPSTMPVATAPVPRPVPTAAPAAELPEPVASVAPTATEPQAVPKAVPEAPAGEEPSASRPEPEVRRRPPPPPRPPRPPPPDDPGLRPWVRLASSLGLRPGIAPSGSGVLSAGLARDLFGLGVGVGLGTRTPLPLAGDERSYAAMPLVAVEGLFGPRLLLLGASRGAAHRRFLDGPDVVEAGFMPFVRAEVAVSATVGRRLRLEPGLAWRRDLGSTEIRRDGVEVLRVPPSTVQATFGIRWR